MANVSLGHIPTGLAATFPQWTGPDPEVIRVQAILYTSLAATLLAAFIAMLGKQWLNRYSQVEMRGSVIDRNRHRQRKMNGMDTWHFDLVMECLPLMLQVALLLLGYALSDYLFFINKVIASVTIGFTTFGLLFYFLIVSAATLSFDCPFQTPLSLILRFLVRFDSEHKKYLERSGKRFRSIFSQKKKRPMETPGSPHIPGAPGASDGNPAADIKLPMASSSDHSFPFLARDIDKDGYVLDSNCIAWMFEMSADPDFIIAIMRFIPEVVWHAGIQTAPLVRFYDTLLGCFDRSSGHPVVIPKLKDKAYFSARAVLHLAIQRKCVGNESDIDAFESISSRHLIMGSEHCGGDSDLESTLGIIDCVFGKSEPMRWEKFSFTIPHHAWMGHILLYRAWDALREDKGLPDDIKGFIKHSVYSIPPPPPPIVADCFVLVGSSLGVGLHDDDLSIVDKR